MHYADTDETMVCRVSLAAPLADISVKIPIFDHEPNGMPRKQKYIMGARNWCSMDRDGDTGELIFDIRVEKERGRGQTVG